MFKIRKGDQVQVIKGKDRGKKGKVLRLFPETNRVLVEGLNKVKKHKRQTRQEQAGGIIDIEVPIRFENVMIICKSCNKPTRVGISKLKDSSKARMCRKCKETI
ncbi:MAG: 50S ribosomal protein L24 [Candidatus Omnitrophica bacterium]|nr:50S ribosomal protein L24 [Candidatus Omnitrophota bacterium]